MNWRQKKAIGEALGAKAEIDNRAKGRVSVFAEGDTFSEAVCALMLGVLAEAVTE